MFDVAIFIQVHQFLTSLFIDYVKSDHLYVVWQTIDTNDKRLWLGVFGWGKAARGDRLVRILINPWQSKWAIVTERSVDNYEVIVVIAELILSVLVHS